MKAIKESSRKRCRPLRIENDKTLWFVSSRTIEEQIWLHPILTSGLNPPNRKARRLLNKFEQHADKRLETLVKKANAMGGPFQPKLTVQVARRIARGLVGSALARAQNKYKTKVFSLVVMMDHPQYLAFETP